MAEQLVAFDSVLNAAIFEQDWALVDDLLDSNEVDLFKPYRVNGSSLDIANHDSKQLLYISLRKLETWIL